MESVKEVKKMRELLEKYLKAWGISVVEFAQEAEASKTTIYDLLKGEKDATKIYANQAIKIAKAMNISSNSNIRSRLSIPYGWLG